jgi:hypothetical protein
MLRFPIVCSTFPWTTRSQNKQHRTTEELDLQNTKQEQDLKTLKKGNPRTQKPVFEDIEKQKHSSPMST